MGNAVNQLVAIVEKDTRITAVLFFKYTHKGKLVTITLLHKFSKKHCTHV